MKITSVTCHVLLDPGADPNATSSALDDLVVEIHTDDGLVGVGETDTNPWVARAFIDSVGTHTMGLGLEEMIVGADPLDTDALWERMYIGSAMSGRRGSGICAMGAIDMALWDIRGKAAGKPCWQLIGDAAHDRITPYASLQPEGDDAATYTRSLIEWLGKARSIGFAAAKLEVTPFGPYAHQKLRGDDDTVVEIVTACREAIGPDFTLMVDVQYAWSDARRALKTLKRLEPLDLFFIETPLWIDDLDGYAYLHDHLDMRIAVGEWQTTRFEFADLMDRGGIDVAQPDVGRVGGLTEAMKVCEMAAERERLIVPHCWKTAIGIAASVHMAATTPHCPYVEFLPADLCDSALRRDLTVHDVPMIDGSIPLPDAPGLGVELDPDALARFDAGRNIS
ncbi:MAG: mandelate racemase [Phycisphaeraceae bacterium]|nr:mandelate racemase [Phycisphaeraceae bacterium]